MISLLGVNCITGVDLEELLNAKHASSGLRRKINNLSITVLAFFLRSEEECFVFKSSFKSIPVIQLV